MYALGHTYYNNLKTKQLRSKQSKSESTISWFLTSSIHSW